MFLIVYSEKSAQSKQVSKELGLAGALNSHDTFGELRHSVMELLGTGQSSAPVQQSVPVLQTVPSQSVQQTKPVAPVVQQEIPVQPAKSSETSDKKKKLIPIIAASVALVAVIAIVLAVVLSGGSRENADGSGTGAEGGSTVVSDDVSDDTGAGDDASQSEPETPPAINADALVQAGVDMEPSESEGCRVLANSYDESFNVAGVNYNTGVILSANSAAAVGFNLNGVFKKLSFSVGQFDSDHTGDLKVRVYLDGNEAQPIVVSPDSLKQYEYDITGVKQIRFECDNLNFAPQVGVTDIVVSK